MKIKCDNCNGLGWYAEHSEYHYMNQHDPDCSKYGCPVQIQCEKCLGTGEIECDHDCKHISQGVHKPAYCSNCGEEL